MEEMFKGQAGRSAGASCSVVLYNPGYESSCMLIWFSAFSSILSCPVELLIFFFFPLCFT